MDTLVRIVLIGLLLGGVYGLVALGLNLIFGVTRVVNFAQGELVMVGMYATYLLQRVTGLHPYVTFIVVVPVLFALGLAIQRFAIRPLGNQHTLQIFVTFGLVLLLQNGALALTNGETLSVPRGFANETVGVGDVRVDYGRLVIFVVTTVLAVALTWFLRSTRTGRAIRAVTQNRRAAALMGIDVDRMYLLAFGLGAALAGLAGVLLAPVYSLTPTVGQNFIFAAFAVVVLGGLGSVVGCYVGGLLIGLVEAVSGYYVDPTLATAFSFLVFLLVLLVRPAGLFGLRGAEEVGTR